MVRGRKYRKVFLGRYKQERWIRLAALGIPTFDAAA
jgi:hypothetical protein